jgi:hypothetical protein
LDQDLATETARADSLIGELAQARKGAEAAREKAAAAQAEAKRLGAEFAEAKSQAQDREARNAVAQARIESLASTLAATQLEVKDLQASASRAESDNDLLLDAVDGWKAEAGVLAESLAKAEDRLARVDSAALELQPQAGPSIVAPIGPAPDRSVEAPKPKSATALAPAKPTSESPATGAAASGSRETGSRSPVSAPQTARLDDPAGRMLSHGDRYLKLGDVASARLFYRQAADMGAVAALTAVAQTYDPRMLKARGVLGGFANPVAASDWYERAITAGDGQAAADLAAMRAWLNP